ncbi:MAG: agl cluster protein AglQ, partial [Candidatus Poseidoniia archaeon]|nr:agl cluster protein AglQ [Candidatus Poseidoniia archaeon]
MKLIEFIIELSQRAIKEPSKYLAGGHNGPYLDPETPVRNKGHWLITLGKVFQITSDSEYQNTVGSLADDLYNHDARPHGYSFYHRF